MTTVTRSKRYVAGLVLVVSILACGGGAPGIGGGTPEAQFATATPGGSISISLLTPTVTLEGAVQDTQLIGPVATQTAEAAAIAAQTATAAVFVPTPTIPGVFTEPARCPTPGTPTLPSQAPGFTRYGEVIVQYLSAGGAPTVLEAGLRSWGALNQFGGLVRGDRDFTGDGVPEVLVLAFDPQREEGTPQPGNLFIFGCKDAAYRLVYQAGYSVDRGAPVLYSADDLNGNFINDIVYSIRTCGATSCLDQVHVIEWSLSLENFDNLLSEEVIQPYAEVVVSDVDEDRLIEVSVTSGIIPQTEAGPQRQITNIYKWDGTLFALGEVLRPVAEYRIHVLHDGDDLLLRGEYGEAITEYRRAINSDRLRSWAYPDEEAYLKAYARYRLMLSYIRAGNLNAGQTAHDELLALYNPPPPPCDPAADPNCQLPPTATPSFGPPAGIEFAHIADLFWADYSVNRRLNVACNLVVGYVQANPFALDVLNSFGYANRVYRAQDMCPWGG